MTGLLEFPPTLGRLPANVGRPPFVRFHIRGRDVSDRVPRNVPLAMLLHFAPRAADWEVRSTETRPSQAAPHPGRVDIDIPAYVSATGLAVVLIKMMTSSHLTTTMYVPSPLNVRVAVETMQVWDVMGLDLHGAEPLRNQILTAIWFFPFSAADMDLIWRTFHHESEFPVAIMRCYVQRGLEWELDDEEAHLALDLISDNRELRALYVRCYQEAARARSQAQLPGSRLRARSSQTRRQSDPEERGRPRTRSPS